MAYGSGKSAVITGAASGMGRALALQLNREGCGLHICDIDEQGLRETVALLAREDVPVASRVLDVADKQAVHAWADDIGSQQAAVDLVVNNAGVAVIATVENSSYEDLEWLMGINFWGVVYGCMAFLPLLRRSQQGHLVNTSSIFGIIGVPTQSAYNAAKFAVRGYTESLRQELQHSNVHVMCVHPGGIKTNIARNGRSSDSSMTEDERGVRFEELAKTTAESAAAQILKGVEKKKKRLLIGNDARYLSFISRLFPVNYPRFIPGMAEAVNTL